MATRGRKLGTVSFCPVCKLVGALDRQHYRKTCVVYKRAVELFDCMDSNQRLIYINATITKGDPGSTWSARVFLGMNGKNLADIEKLYPEFAKAIYCLATAGK